MKSKEKVTTYLEQQKQILETIERALYSNTLSAAQVLELMKKVTLINELITNLVNTEY